MAGTALPTTRERRGRERCDEPAALGPVLVLDPFIERTHRNATAQDINAQNMDLTARLTSHLLNPGK
jgi:hypothetical protein